MAVGAVVARIISQYSDKGSKAAQKDIAKLGKNIDAFAKKATKAFAIATAASVAFAAKIGKDAVEGAISDAKSANILAQTLKNVTGATQGAIDATELYLKQAEKVSNLTGEELRQSLGSLVVSTKHVEDAMWLQGIALDVAAGTGKDLQSVTMALVKAQQGNLGSLKKLGVPLDDTIVKNKDLYGALLATEKAFKGQAKIAGDSDPFTRLQRSYEDVLDTLGYALLPVVIEFTKYIDTEVLPKVKAWIDLNKDELAQSLKDISDALVVAITEGDAIIKVLDSFKTIVDILSSSFLGLIRYIELFATVLLLRGVYKSFKAITGGVGKEILTTGKRYDVAIDKTKVFGKGITSAASKVGKFAKFAVTRFGWVGLAVTAVGATTWTLNKIQEIQNRNDIKRQAATEVAYSQSQASILKGYQEIEKAVNGVTLAEMEQRNSILAGFAQIEEAVKKANEKAKADADRAARLAKIDADQRARELADLKKKQALERGLAKLKALGIKGEIKEDDPIQLEAARLLLLKQGNLAELEKLKRMTEEINLMKVRNDLAKRYQDILTALADNEISTKEIAILSEKWGVTKEAVEAYLTSFFAISDGKIDDSEVIKLAKQWGSTEDQARQYLQFLDALNDGLLSDYEINELKKNWGLTEEQVRQYADFVAVVNDGKLTDAEVIKLMDKWKLTTDQVVDYIKKIGSPVSYSGTLIDPAKAAEIGWLNATAALQRYLDLLKAGTGTVVNGGTPANPVVPVVPVIPTTPGGFPEVQIPDGNMPSAQAATVYALAKAAGDMETAAKAAAQVNPSALAAGESGAIGAASIAAQLAKAEQEVKNAATYAAFKAKEAADAAAAVQAATSRDYDERFRFGLNTVNNASSITPGSSASAPVVNITVQGSVSTEQDLVSAVRTGLLQTQYNGNSLLLQAI